MRSGEKEADPFFDDDDDDDDAVGVASRRSGSRRRSPSRGASSSAPSHRRGARGGSAAPQPHPHPHSDYSPAKNLGNNNEGASSSRAVPPTAQGLRAVPPTAAHLHFEDEAVGSRRPRSVGATSSVTASTNARGRRAVHDDDDDFEDGEEGPASTYRTDNNSYGNNGNHGGSELRQRRNGNSGNGAASSAAGSNMRRGKLASERSYGVESYVTSDRSGARRRGDDHSHGGAAAILMVPRGGGGSSNNSNSQPRKKSLPNGVDDGDDGAASFDDRHPASILADNEGGENDGEDDSDEGCNGRLYDLLQTDPEVPAKEIDRIFTQTTLRSQYKEAFRVLRNGDKKRLYDIVGEPCVESLNKGWGDVVQFGGSAFSVVFYGLAIFVTSILFLLFFVFLPVHVDRRARTFNWHTVLVPLYILSIFAVIGALALCAISCLTGNKRTPEFVRRFTESDEEKKRKNKKANRNNADDDDGAASGIGGESNNGGYVDEEEARTRNNASKLAFRHPLGRIVAAVGYLIFVFLVGAALYSGNYPSSWMGYFVILIIVDCLTIIEWMTWLYPQRMRKIFDSYKADNPDVTFANSVVGARHQHHHNTTRSVANGVGGGASRTGSVNYFFLVYGFMIIGCMDFILAILRYVFIGVKCDDGTSMNWYGVVTPLALRFVTGVLFRLHSSRVMHFMAQRTTWQVIFAAAGSLILNMLPFVTTYLVAGYLEGDGGYDLVYAFIPMYFLCAYFFFASIFTTIYLYRRNRDFEALEAHEAAQMRLRLGGSDPYGGSDDDFEEVSIYDDEGNRYVRRRPRGSGGASPPRRAADVMLNSDPYGTAAEGAGGPNGGRRVRYGPGGEVFIEDGFFDDNHSSSEGDEVCLSEDTRDERDDDSVRVDQQPHPVAPTAAAYEDDDDYEYIEEDEEVEEEEEEENRLPFGGTHNSVDVRQ